MNSLLSLVWYVLWSPLDFTYTKFLGYGGYGDLFKQLTNIMWLSQILMNLTVEEQMILFRQLGEALQLT